MHGLLLPKKKDRIVKEKNHARNLPLHLRMRKFPARSLCPCINMNSFYLITYLHLKDIIEQLGARTNANYFFFHTCELCSTSFYFGKIYFVQTLHSSRLVQLNIQFSNILFRVVLLCSIKVFTNILGIVAIFFKETTEVREGGL